MNNDNKTTKKPGGGLPLGSAVAIGTGIGAAIGNIGVGIALGAGIGLAARANQRTNHGEDKDN